MNKIIELKWNEVKTSYDTSAYDFETTDDLANGKGILGEEEARGRLDLGLGMNADHYNIYLSGEDEQTLYAFILEKVTELAKDKRTPDDLCYIYDFDQVDVPKYVTMQPGDGKKLQDDLREFRCFLSQELSECLVSKEVESKKQMIMNEIDEAKDQLVDELKTDAYKVGFKLTLTKEGIGFVPVDKTGKELDTTDYEELDTEKKKAIKKQVDILYDRADETIEAIEELDELCTIKLRDLAEIQLMEELTYHITYFRETYNHYKEIQHYINGMIEDLINNMTVFFKKESEELTGIEALLPFVSPKTPKELVEKYDINVLVSHEEGSGAPVVTGYPLTYNHLVGKIKVSSELPTGQSDFMKIEAGLLHKANGGYLILYVNDLLESSGGWESIKRMLKTGKVTIENVIGNMIASTLSMMPEPIGIHTKIILVGSYGVYDLLVDYDRTFKDFFKVHVHFEEVVDSTKDAIYEFGRMIKKYCESEELPPVTKRGVFKLLEYSQRDASSKEKMSTNMQPIYDLVKEASVFARGVITEKEIVAIRHMKLAFKQSIQKNMSERYEKNFYLIDTRGRKVGQINGLAVYEVEDFTFGKPARITATTFRGRTGVIDIESAVGLSGSIHSKGVHIIRGFLGERFAKEYPLSICCNICFEQSYGGVDGDSASSTELYAILSSLSEVPLKQELAVTGSVNQYGQIQPIGGVNEKIEGFYGICKQRGLTGSQGVIIPYQNKSDLMLDDEVIASIKEGKFHIYAISTIKQGMELLTDMRYGEIECRIQAKLKQYNNEKATTKSKMNRYSKKLTK